MALQVASLYGVLSLRDQGFQQGIRNAQTQTRTFAQNLQNTGRNIRNFGLGMTAATAPIAIGLGIGINKSREFDRAMSNVNAILGVTGGEASSLRSEILAFGGDTVAGPQATAEAFYAIVSGVADASTHMAILEASTKTAEAGQADLMATTSAMISTMNSYNLKAEDAAFVSDVFTRTVGKGVLTMDELASAFPQVTGLAAQFDIPISQLGASMAFLTAQGFSAGQSATFMKSMMTTLLAPTADLETAITGLGYSSGQALLESQGLVGAYRLLADQGGGLAGLITNQEALQGALALTKDSAQGFFNEYALGIEGATAEAGAIQDQTEGWDLLKSKMDEMWIMVGTQLSPILLDLINTKLIPGAEAVIDWAQKNPELFQTLLMVMGAATLAGPVITGVGAAISLAGTVATVASGAVGLLSGGMMAAVGPIIAVGVAVLGVIAAINQFNEITGHAARRAGTQLSQYIQSGAVTMEDARNAAFAAAQAELGDFGARLWFASGNAESLIQQMFTAGVSADASEGLPMQPFQFGGWTGSGPSDQIAGMVHRNEYVVPQGGALVMRGGGGGDITVSGPISIYANDPEEFGMKLRERVRRG